MPSRTTLDARWLPDHRWIALIDGHIAGWAAASPVATQPSYSGVAETLLGVDPTHRDRGVGEALLYQQVTKADQAGLWTLQATLRTTDRTGIALHHSAGYRTVGVRERLLHLHDTWHDAVLLERRTTA